MPALIRRPARRLRRNPEDRAVVRELMDKLTDFKYAVMEASGEDPEYTRFDMNDYPINKYALESYLDTKVLGWGATRVVVTLPSGNVAKLPWGDEERETNVREWENWQEASPEVRRMLLPPLELFDGVIVFPRVVTEDRRDYDDPDLVAAERDAWEVRELMRILRDVDVALEREKERRELGRRRALTDEERLAEDRSTGRYRAPGEARGGRPPRPGRTLVPLCCN